MKTPPALIALSLLTASVHAAVLVDWNLDTVNYPGYPAAAVNNDPFTGVPNTVATVAGNLSAGDLVTASSGTPGTQAGDGLVWGNGNAGPNKLNLQRWDYVDSAPNTTTGTADGTPNNWLQFSLSAAPGYSFELATIDVSAWRNGAGAPANWAFGYSTDNGASWTPFGSTHTESNAGDSTFRDVAFTGSVTSSELLIRFTAVGPSGGTGNLHLNRMVVQGTVVPEPAVALLGGLGMLGLLRRRRR